MVAVDALVWVEELCGDGTSMFRSTGGRFDIVYVHEERGWRCYDWDAGKRSRVVCLADAKEWAEQRCL